MQRVAAVFRKWPGTGDVIALFPELPADANGWFCDSYEHVGQHGGADYQGVIFQTVAASPAESAALALELKQLGYQLKPLNRAAWRHHERWRRAAMAFRSTDTGCDDGTRSPTSREGER